MNLYHFNSTKLTDKRLLSVLLLVSALCLPTTGRAQCYGLGYEDPIMSSFHSSIAKTATGGFRIWGESANGNGLSHLLSPVNLVSGTNNFNFTGTPLHTTLASNSLNNVQFFLLTSTNLYVWGNEQEAIDGRLTADTDMQIVGAGVAGFPTNGLPPGINPSDIKMMDASGGEHGGGGLLLLTNWGHVWILSFNSSMFGDGGTGETVWHQVTTDEPGNPTLTNIIDARVSGLAVIATTRTYQFYTWGIHTFLGDGSAAVTRPRATLMNSPLPSGIAPRQVDISGTMVNLASSRNTDYYILGLNGLIYCVGDNTNLQLGIGSATTTQTSWQTVKNSAGTSPLTNVVLVTVNNHEADATSGYGRGAAAITADGSLYVWGSNDSFEIGGPADTNYGLPITPCGFNPGTDKALFAEMGGHTFVHYKEGATRYCYVGHKRHGSMGDGSSAEASVPCSDCNATGTLAGCTQQKTDYGDAPVSYEFNAAASHTYSFEQTLLLGRVDGDDDGAAPHSTTTAQGDDETYLDDEDGVASLPALSTSTSTYSLSVAVTNNYGVPATLAGWIDFNRNGTFESTERTQQTVPVSATLVTLTWSGLSGLVAGPSYIRLRLAAIASEVANATGVATSGEVEDYALTISTTITGNIFNDTNGLTDNAVNGSSINGTALPQVSGPPLPVFVSLVQGSTILTTAAVTADGSYTLTGISTGSYSIVLTTNPAGSITPSLPVGWSNTGENIGTSIGNDGTVDGKLLLIVSGSAVVDANFGIKQLTDLTLLLYARPTSIHGTSTITVVVDVVEINSIASSGLFTVKITKDARVNLSFPTSATVINNRLVQNNVWTFNGNDPNYYTLSTSQSVEAGNKLSFGLTGELNPAATSGVLAISATLLPTGIIEAQQTNNADADKIDYFQN